MESLEETVRDGVRRSGFLDYVFKMDDGNFFIYPNNRIIWRDDAWTYKRIESNPGYKIDMNEYSVENKRKVETDYSYITEFKKVK